MAANKGYTDDQILAAVSEIGTKSGAARHLGMDERTLKRRIKRIDARRNGGETPEPVPKDADHRVKGRSTLYDAQTGEARLEWVKTTADDDKREAAMQAAIAAFSEEIPRAEPVPKPLADGNADRLNLFVMADLHMGALAWAPECGEDYDTDIAEDLARRWMDEACRSAPDAGRAVLAINGDVIHFDGLESVTNAHGYPLDADTRFDALVKRVIRTVRYLVRRLLETHQTVDLICVTGNHDETAATWLRQGFAAFYEEDDQVTVDESPSPYHAIEHGLTSLFFTHGHLAKTEQVDRVFASKFRNLFGRSRFSYAHTGHLHHRKTQETPLMTVEQHQALSAKDSHAARNGYSGDRSAQVITYSAKHGEVGRVRLTPEMVQRD